MPLKRPGIVRSRLRYAAFMACAAILLMASARATAATPADTLHDPQLRTGTLPNGMRYYVRSNRMPAHRAFLWMAVNAGSILEADDQRGYAHFLEHMAFNGTTHFPRNELVRFVESTGMEFGADLNAYTSFDETVYKLTLPTDDSSAVDRGLQVMQDWASGGITLDSSEVVAERGVVMGEWRLRDLRDTLSERLYQHEMDVLFGTTKYRARSPIGDTALIRHATPEPIRRFFTDWYRPDLMAVIAVGDFDVDRMEAQIRQRFGAIPRRNGPTRPPVEPPRVHGTMVDVLRDKVPPRVDVMWPLAPEPRRTVDRVEQELVHELLLEHMSHKLTAMREQRAKPFVFATMGEAEITRGAPLLTASVVAWPDSLMLSLRSVLSELERVAQRGVPDAMLAEEKAALLHHLEGDSAGMAAHSSADYVESYTRHFLTGQGTLLDANQRLAIARQVLSAITPARMAEAARFWRERDGTRVLIRMPYFSTGFVPPTERSVVALWDSVQHLRLPVDTALASLATAPLIPGTPQAAGNAGHVVSEHRDSVSGITEWTLSNGARVLFKPSGNDPDDLRIRAWSPGGFSLVPDSLFFSSGRMVADILTQTAGVGSDDRDALLTPLSSTGIRELRVKIGYADEQIDVAGSPRETELLFQALHRQFVAPRLDSAALAMWKNFARYEQRNWTMEDEFNALFTRGNPRLMPVQPDLVDLVNPDEAMAVYRDRFGNAGDFTFFIVGAATPGQLKPLVEQYLASLPATNVREQPQPAHEDTVLAGTGYHQSRALPFPRADTWLLFYGSFPSQPDEYLRERQRLSALTILVQRRLRDRLREQMGGTYGVLVRGFTQRLSGEDFRLVLNFQASPDDVRNMDREMLRTLDSVRVAGATAEEADVVSHIQRRRLENLLQDNGYWMDQMELYNRLGIPMDRIVMPYPQLRLTADDFRAAAARYLPKNASLYEVVLPEPRQPPPVAP
jgi:zinc protease